MSSQVHFCAMEYWQLIIPVGALTRPNKCSTQTLYQIAYSNIQQMVTAAGFKIQPK